MMAYPNLKNEDTPLLKNTAQDDEVKELNEKTEKHDLENIMKPFRLLVNIIKRDMNLQISGKSSS